MKKYFDENKALKQEVLELEARIEQLEMENEALIKKLKEAKKYD